MKDYSITKEFNLSTFIREKQESLLPLMERILFFKEVEIFRNIDTDQLLYVAEIASELEFNKNDAIARENEIGDSLYIVKKGSLKIMKEKDGHPFFLGILKPGECFGEMGLFGNAPRYASAYAAENATIVFTIRKSDFKKVLLDNPEITYNLLEIFSEKIRKSNQEVMLLQSFLNKEIRKERIRE